MKTTLPVLLVSCLAWLVTASVEAGEVDRPNVVLIVVDDLGSGEVGCYPQTHADPIRTPHIDGLAREGIRMTDGYSAHPMCWPSRASLLTGRYYQRFLRGTVIPESETLIGQRLKKAGYATGCVGKWHNTGSVGAWNGRAEDHPLGRGFDEFFGFLGGMHDYIDADVGTHFLQGRNRPYYMPIYEGTRRVPSVRYLTEELTERAVSFIERHAAKPWPFFLYLSYNAVHTPTQAPEEYVERCGGDVHRAMIAALDDGVGAVLAKLAELGIDRSSMVWFVGDNGGYRDGSNWRLRAQKGRWFEGGIRVPFIVRWPGALPAGKAYEHPVMHIDVAPTILAAAGLSPPRDLDGTSLLPHLRGETAEPPHELLFWGDPGGARLAVRRGDWKLLRESDARDGEPELRLYNLRDDVEERRNLLDVEPDVAAELRKAYERWAEPIARERRSP